MIVAGELATPIRVTSGPAIERAGDLAALLTSLTEGEVLFIDEIHRIARPAEELLYMAMEDFRVDVVVGKGPGATAIPLDLAPFTLVGATTRAGLLTGPLRDRFGFTAHMDFYDPGELEQVLYRSAQLLDVDIDADGASRDRVALARHAAHREPAAAAGARLRRGARRRPRHRADRPRRAGGLRRRPARPRPPRPRRARRARHAASAAARSASAPSPSPWAKRSRPSKRSPNPSSCVPDCSLARRADGSQRRPPGSTSESTRAAPDPARAARRCSTNDVVQRITQY